MIEQEELTSKITQAISEIKVGTITPKKSGIGKMLMQLQLIDQTSYQQMLAEYKPVSVEYFTANPSTTKAAFVRKDALMQKEIEKSLRSVNDDLHDNQIDEDFSNIFIPNGMNLDDDERPKSKRPPIQVKPKSIDRARVARVMAMTVPKVQKPKGERDRSALVFMGQEYGKGPLVRAVITFIASDNTDITCDDLKKMFPDSLLRSYGIFKKFEEAQEISKVRKRYFMKDDQLIQLKDCKIAVCNQFTSDNIKPFLSAAKKLGHFIE